MRQTVINKYANMQIFDEKRMLGGQYAGPSVRPSIQSKTGVGLGGRVCEGEDASFDCHTDLFFFFLFL